MDVTLDKLLETADYYLTILNNEDKNFDASKAQFNSKVSDGEAKIISLKELVLQKSEETARRTEEIGKTQAEIQDLENTVKESMINIEDAE